VNLERQAEAMPAYRAREQNKNILTFKNTLELKGYLCI